MVFGFFVRIALSLSGCSNKIPQARQFKNNRSSLLTVLEAAKSQVQVPGRLLSGEASLPVYGQHRPLESLLGGKTRGLSPIQKGSVFMTSEPPEDPTY